MKRLFLLPIAGVLFLSFFFLTSDPTYAQNQFWQTIIGEPEPAVDLDSDNGGSDGGSGGGSGQMVSCPSDNFRSCLADQFNVTVRGAPRPSDLQATYRGLRLISPYTAFYNAFKRGRITITYGTTATCSSPYWCAGSGAWAFVDTTGDMYLFRNIWNSSQGQTYVNYFMIHEGAHVADDYMGRANQTLYYNAYTLGKDRDCFDYGIIKTYPTLGLIGSNPDLRRRQNETFAESIVNSLLCRPGQLCGFNGGGTKIQDWPNKCSYINKYVNRVIN